MSVAVELQELLAYTDHERAKWRAWVEVDPSRMRIPVQDGGRFPTIGSAFAHIFLVERRHLSRLEGITPPTATGVDEADPRVLFDYGAGVRAEFTRYVEAMTSDVAASTVVAAVQTGTFTFSRRKLAVHIVLHEIRHCAQIALAARSAGVAPPGEHDLFYFAGMQ